MTVPAPFKPHFGGGINIVAAAATPANAAVGAGDKTLRVVNSGTGLTYFRTGNSKTIVGGAASIIATLNDCPILPSGTVTIEKPQEDDYIAWLSTPGSTLIAIGGEGGIG